MNDREADAICALSGVSVEVPNGLGPLSSRVIVHGSDHRLEDLRRLTLPRQELAYAHPAGVVSQLDALVDVGGGAIGVSLQPDLGVGGAGGDSCITM